MSGHRCLKWRENQLRASVALDFRQRKVSRYVGCFGSAPEYWQGYQEGG